MKNKTILKAILAILGIWFVLWAANDLRIMFNIIEKENRIESAQQLEIDNANAFNKAQFKRCIATPTNNAAEANRILTLCSNQYPQYALEK